MDVAPTVGDEVGGVDLELLRRRLEEHAARLLRGGDHCIADPVRAAGGEAAHAVGAGVRVGGVDEHVLDRDAERLRADLAHHALHALPEVDGGEADGELAAGIGVHQRLARVPAEVHADGVVDRGDPAPASLRHCRQFPRTSIMTNWMRPLGTAGVLG